MLAQKVKMSYGNILWWGFSPPINIMSSQNDESDKQKILILDAGDGRHLLSIMFHQDRKTEIFPIHCFISEKDITLYARQILFLSILFKGSNLDLDQTAKRFLQIFGNIKLTPDCHELLCKTSKDLARKIVSSRHASKDVINFTRTMDENDENYSRLWLGPITIDLSRLKFREIDALEQTFNRWAESEDRREMEKYWDSRLRYLLGQRYNCKDGVFDMDYFMRVKDRVADRISSTEYRSWRSTGQAFLFENEEDEELMRDNLTLTSDFERGYCGDIVTGPFFSFLKEGQRPSSDLPARDIAYEFVRNGLRSKQLTSMTVTFLPLSNKRDLIESDKYNDYGFTSGFVGVNATSEFILEDSSFVRFKRNFIQDPIIFVENPSALNLTEKDVLANFEKRVWESCANNGMKLMKDRDYFLQDGEVDDEEEGKIMQSMVFVIKCN